jgi:hypothetical protein
VSIERMPEGAVPHVPAGGPGSDASAVSPSVRLQMLATEHWSLLATRSMGYQESFSRAGMFLSVLSGAVVSLALVAQAMNFGPGFELFALVLLPVVLFVGLATFVRLVQVNNEDVRWVAGMNRLRHAYLEMDPTIAPYFITAWHDDEYALLVTFGSSPRGLRFVHGFVTTPGMLVVINGVIAGVLAGLVTVTLAPLTETVLLVAIGVAAFVILVVAQATYQSREMTIVRRAFRPHFPHAADPASLQQDDEGIE